MLSSSTNASAYLSCFTSATFCRKLPIELFAILLLQHIGYMPLNLLRLEARLTLSRIHLALSEALLAEVLHRIFDESGQAF